MKQDYTHITIVLDKSGSMATLRNDMIGSFNEFIKTQKAVPGEATLTLALFSNFTQWEGWYQTPINFHPLSKVEELTESQYVPNGSTPLLDAVGRAIVETGEKLASLDEKDRPGAVLFVIMTDGEENSSREYSNAAIAAMIKEQTEKYQWVFSFIGANQDSFATARNYNIPQGNVMNFAPTGAGAQSVGKTLSHAAAQYRATPTAGKILMKESLYDNTPDLEGVEKMKKPLTKGKK